jgi:hypothetical protein
MAEIAPEVAHPTQGKTMLELWREFDSAGHVMEVVNL